MRKKILLFFIVFFIYFKNFCADIKDNNYVDDNVINLLETEVLLNEHFIEVPKSLKETTDFLLQYDDLRFLKNMNVGLFDINFKDLNSVLQQYENLIDSYKKFDFYKKLEYEKHLKLKNNLLKELSELIKKFEHLKKAKQCYYDDTCSKCSHFFTSCVIL